MTPSTDDKIDIITSISEGSRSAVYLATDSTDNFVVYKKIKGENRILLYKRIADSGLEFFPKIFKMDYSDGVNYVIEEYIEGKDLRKLLKEGVDYDKAVELTEQLMEAVNCLHKLDPPLLHRDIKPENIIVSPDGKLRLIDFDAAREYDDDEKEHDTVMLGTRGYAAPEQFGFNQTDVRSDIYSVGIVCNQIFENIDVSANKKAKILKCFSKATMFDPNERYHNMEEMLQAFKKARSKTINKNIFIIGSICACLIIIVIVWALNSKNDLPGTTDGIEQKALTVANNEKNDNSGIVSHEEKNKTEKEVENITNSPEKEEESSVPEENEKNEIPDDPTVTNIPEDEYDEKLFEGIKLVDTTGGKVYEYYDPGNAEHWLHPVGTHWEYWGIYDEEDYYPEIILPHEVKGIPVTSIGEWALASKTKIKVLTIPASYTEIKDHALDNMNPELVIHVYQGSYAEKYCIENKMKYKVIGLQKNEHKE